MQPLSDFEIQKYHDLKRLSGKEIQMLKEARILVIGAGEMGRTVLMHVAEAGIGTIGIADFARIESDENATDPIYVVGDTKKFKTQSAAEQIREKFNECTINCHNIRISRMNIVPLVSSYDIVVDCSNNNPAHNLISDVTELIDIPMVYGVTTDAFGMVSVFNYAGGPSFRCLPGDDLSYSELSTENDPGMRISLSAMVGLIQACEAVKITTGAGEILSGILLKIDKLTHDTETTCFSIPEGYQASGIRDDYGTDDYTSPSSITSDELKMQLQEGIKLTIFDIRSPEQFIKFNIGGINVNAGYLLNNPEDIPIEGKVVIVCELGDESLAIVDYLNNNESLTNVLNLEGGIQGWLDSMV